MKSSSLFSLITCAALLLPVSVAQAAKPGSFGGLTSGLKFTLKVTSVESFAQEPATGALTTAPIPKTVPKFKLGQKVKFSIGKKGQLRGPGFSLDFASNARGSLRGWFLSRSHSG